MNTGVCFYCGTAEEKNAEIIARAADAGIRCAFTSLQIPEESRNGLRSSAQNLLSACKKYGMDLVMDVGPDTAERLGCRSLYDLQNWGVTQLRLDDGYSPQQAAELSHTFQIVFNASTVSFEEITGWQKAGADLTRFTACHNYYPKPWTGLPLAEVAQVNRQLKTYGFQTMAFVPGDGMLRGPLYEGLPTVEAHRRRVDIVRNALELFIDAACDTVLVGDVSLSESSWAAWADLSRGFVSLPAELDRRYHYLAETVHHDRRDSSECVFRSVESRRIPVPDRELLQPAKETAYGAGDILLSNTGFLRYEGELEIARVPLPSDPRINVIGRLKEEALPYLPYLRNGLGIRFVVDPEG